MAADGQVRPSVRERLLTAADDLFYRDGIVATGVDAVVARAGVATASLYKSFAGKDDLVRAYLDERDRRWRECWETRIAESRDEEERALALFTAMRRWTEQPGRDRGCAHVAASLQLGPQHPGRRVARAHKEHLGRRLEPLVAATGAADPADVTADLLLIYEGMLAAMVVGRDPDPIGRAGALADQRLRRARRAP